VKGRKKAGSRSQVRKVRNKLIILKKEAGQKGKAIDE
jgi:hypothetical protein